MKESTSDESFTSTSHVSFLLPLTSSIDAPVDSPERTRRRTSSLPFPPLPVFALLPLLFAWNYLKKFPGFETQEFRTQIDRSERDLAVGVSVGP